MTKLALLFPGGGTQYVGMAKYYYDNFTIAREVMEEASDALGYDLKSLCFQGPLAELSRIEFSQVAIYTASVIAFRVFQQEAGLPIDYLAGHSLGEYAALTGSGVITFGQGINLVKKRGLYLSEAGGMKPGDMLAASKISEETLMAYMKRCDPTGALLHIAVHNSASQHVISGTREKVKELSEILQASAEATVLNINIPSHSPLVSHAAVMMRKEFLACTFGDFQIPVISNVTALPYQRAEQIADTLELHITRPVLWDRSINYLRREGVINFIDIGPQSILKNLLKFIDPDVNGFGYDAREDARQLLHAFGRKAFDPLSFVKKCLVVAAGTINRNNDLEAYNDGVVKPYHALRAIRAKVASQSLPEDIVKTALDLTEKILVTKHLPLSEREELMQSLISETV